jgi:hypothetical protein
VPEGLAAKRLRLREVDEGMKLQASLLRLALLGLCCHWLGLAGVLGRRTVAKSQQWSSAKREIEVQT